MAVWIHKYAAEPVVKHPGHGDQAVHGKKKGSNYSDDPKVNGAIDRYKSGMNERQEKKFKEENQSAEARGAVVREVAGEYESFHGGKMDEEIYDTIDTAVNSWLSS